MPTLIRIGIVLLVLVAVGYGAMFALVMSVSPAVKDVTIHIPQRELVAAPEREPLVRREINTRPTAATPSAVPPVTGSVSAVPPPAANTDTDVKTVQQGVE